MLSLNYQCVLLYSFVVFVEIVNTSEDAPRSGVLKFFNPQEPKIINGTAASLNATSHQVSIRKRRNDGYFFGTGHVCGGSLISENVVLCAAHCFVNYDILEPRGTFYADDYFIAVMGNLDRFEKNNNTLVFDFKEIVKRVDVFNLSTFDDDIALIILDGKVPAKHPTVRPIILNDGLLKNNTICHATGWGLSEEGYSPDILMAVDVPIVDLNDCREKTLYGDAILASMLCAGYLEGEKDACEGDSGGPLVCGGLQAGIVSWGSGCALPLSPGVYTNVTYYKNWILEEIANHNGTLPMFASLDGGEKEEEKGDGDEGKEDNGDTDGNGDGVTGLSCSMLLINFIIMFNCLMYFRNFLINKNNRYV